MEVVTITKSVVCHDCEQEMPRKTPGSVYQPSGAVMPLSSKSLKKLNPSVNERARKGKESFKGSSMEGKQFDKDEILKLKELAIVRELRCKQRRKAAKRI